MESIKITVTGAQAALSSAPVITAGTVGLPVEFTFDEAWKDLGKTAVFRCGQYSYPVSCVQSRANVPWEVLQKSGCGLYVGVFGTAADGAVQIPTVWVLAGTVQPGTVLPETKPEAPTAGVYEQILAAANEAVAKVDVLRKEADEGVFKGDKGDKGDAGVVEFKIVPQLPAEDIQNAIYLVPTADGAQDNVFAEYIWVDGHWEQIGSASVEVDLSEYVKKTDKATMSAGSSYGNANLGLVRCKGPLYGGLSIDSYGGITLFSQSDPTADRRPGVEHQAVTTSYFNAFLKESLAGVKYPLVLTQQQQTTAQSILGVSGLIEQLEQRLKALEEKGNEGA